MKDWQKFYEENREDIEKFMGNTCRGSIKARQIGNKALANELYKMVISDELRPFLLAEAAERLSTINETFNENVYRN